MSENTPIDYEKVAETLDGFLTEHKPDRLILSEIHSDGMINLDMLKHPKVQAVLQKHGFKDIAIEGRHEFQKAAQEVAVGAITSEVLGQQAVGAYQEAGDQYAHLARPIYEKRGELVASTAGKMNVHFVEAQAPTLNDHLKTLNEVGNVTRMKQNILAEKATIDDVWDGLKHHVYKRIGYESGVMALAREQGAEEAQRLKGTVAEKALNQIREKRNSHDDELVASINEKAEGRKVVVLYGDDHGTGTKDLDDQFQSLGSKTARLTLVKDPANYANKSQYDYNMGNQAPTAYLSLSDGSLVNGAEAYKEAAKAYPNPADKESARESYLKTAKAAAPADVSLAEVNPIQPEGGFSQNTPAVAHEQEQAAGRYT